MTHLVFYAILLLLIFFLAGCFFGAWFYRRRHGQAGSTALAKGEPKAADKQSAAKQSADDYIIAAPEDAAPQAPVTAKKPTTEKPAAKKASAKKGKTGTKKSAGTAKEAAKDASDAGDMAAPAIAEDDRENAKAADEAGSRPAALDAPRGGSADNLKRIKGIGPVNEGRLNRLGIYHFEQIAAWGEDEIAWVNTFLSFKGRIQRENWVGQAGDLAKSG